MTTVTDLSKQPMWWRKDVTITNPETSVNNVVFASIKNWRDIAKEQFGFDLYRYNNHERYALTSELDRPNFITWKLMDIETWWYSYKDKGWEERYCEQIILWFEHWDDKMKLSLTYNNITREMMYKLASYEWSLNVYMEVGLYWISETYKWCNIKIDDISIERSPDIVAEAKRMWTYTNALGEESYDPKVVDKWIKTVIVPSIKEKIWTPVESAQAENKEEVKEEMKEDLNLPF